MKLVPAADLDAATLARAEQIYLDAFPPALRAPMENLLADRTLVLLTDDATPCGLAVLREMPGTGWIYLRYFLAGPRGKGIGSELWRHLTRRLAADGYTRMIFDVEDPDEPGIDGEEAHTDRRRIAFYQRLGARLLRVRGYAPPHDGHPTPMLLMATDLTADQPPEITGPALRTLVLATYHHRYNLQATDPAVRQTLTLSGLA